MDVATAVGRVHASVDPAAALADVARLCGYDRYQSSAGIGAAADYVAERAAAAGLSDVRVLRYAAAGRHWWTYRVPPAWTPVRATLALADAAGRPLRTVVDYPAQPYALAAYSAATPPGGVVAPLRHDGGDCRGAVVLLDGAAGPRIAAAARAGAVAVVATAGGGGGDHAGGDGRVGRIELPPAAGIAAFSVDPARWRELADWARIGGRARLRVDLAGPAELPVVTGRIPGRTDQELLLSAHLCHPRPSANDNASGVAALLALVPGLAAGPAELGVRFVWGPEFLGLAAYLHEVVGAGAAPAPVVAINVDMAGEDQRRCGGPLIVERGPDDLPSYLNAVVEGCAAALPQAGRSYSGAVGCDTWAWRPTPFVGASDHLLIVEPPTSRPAVSLGHWPDRFNHSAADTLDKVDPAELRRTATVAGAAVTVIQAAAAGEAADLLGTVVSWSAGRLLDCLDLTVHSGQLGSTGDRPDYPARLLRHRAGVVAGAVRAVATLAPAAAAAVADAERWVAGLARQLTQRLPPAGADDGPAWLGPRPGQAAAAGGGLARGWDGPFNLRALVAAAEPADRDWFERWLQADRGGGYARVVAVARALDGGRDAPAVLDRAALASELPLPAADGDRLLALLRRSGWAVPAAPARIGLVADPEA